MVDVFDNNPEGLDTAGEIRGAIRAAGGNPMDTDTREQAQFGLSILKSWEDDPPASRADPSVLAAEAELVADTLQNEHGVDDIEWPDIEGAPAWYDGR